MAPVPATVGLVDVDPDAAALIGEWLVDAGLTLVADGAAADLLLLALPFPRRDGPARVAALRRLRPAAGLVVMSPTFHAGVAAGGPLAHELGADALVPQPLTQGDLLAAVRQGLAARR